MKRIYTVFFILAAPTAAFSGTSGDDFKSFNCTQAVAFVADQIITQQPVNTLPEIWKKGEAETIAIQFLSQFQNSPCASKSLVNRYGFEPSAQSEKR